MICPASPARRCLSCRTSPSISTRSSSACAAHDLLSARIAHPFLLRTVDPPLSALFGRKVVALRRIGKRIALRLRRRSVAGAASHDRRPPALVSGGHEERADARRWRHSPSRPAHSRSPRPAPSGARRCMSSAAARRSRRTIPAASKCWRRRSKHFARASPRRITRSSARSRIRAPSAASAMRTRTRSCTTPGLSPVALTQRLDDAVDPQALRFDPHRAARVDPAPARRRATANFRRR